MRDIDIFNFAYDWAGEDIDLTDDGGAIIAIDSGQFGFLKLNNIQNNLIEGDINGDSSLNVQDVVLAINLALSNTYNNLADLNSDNQIDVLDVVLIINIVLN